MDRRTRIVWLFTGQEVVMRAAFVRRGGLGATNGVVVLDRFLHLGRTRDLLGWGGGVEDLLIICTDIGVWQ